MKRKRLSSMGMIWGLALILTAVCLMHGAAAAGAEDPAAVRVGAVEYPLSLAQYVLDSWVDMLRAGGEELTEETRQQALDRTADRLKSLAVIENRLEEAGLNRFTEDEMDILRAEAANQYEQAWQSIYQDTLQYDETVTEAEVTAWMEEKGYTQDAFLRELMVSEREGRMLDLYCADVTVTEEQVRQYYREQYLEPDRERYADNVPLYEQEILLTGSEAFFTPEGYRYVKNILLAFPEEIQKDLDAMQMEGKKRVKAVENAYDRLARAAAAGEDQTELKAAYDARTAELREQEEKYRAKEKEAIPLLAETIGTIREQLAAGISIETLLAQYSLDQQQTGTDKPGALFHPDSALWPEDIRQAICALDTPGQLSEPCADETGVHLFYYAGDAPGGERALTAEEEEALRASALYWYQTEKLSGLIEGWLPEYEIYVNLDGLEIKDTY